MLKRVALLFLILAPSLFARARVSGYCTQGGQVVVTSGVQSVTKVQQSYPSCSLSVFYAGGLTGTVSTSGTTVTLTSSGTFNTSGEWSNLQITISGTPYTISSVTSPTTLNITASAGVQTDVSYSMPVNAPAAIFSDNNGTILTNPFTASPTGYWYFYPDNGPYDVKASGGGIPSPITWGALTAFDPTTPSFEDVLVIPPTLYNPNPALPADICYDTLGHNIVTQPIGTFGPTDTVLWSGTSPVMSPNWAASTIYPIQFQIVDPAGHIQQATGTGLSGAAIPTFNDSGGTTSDGGLTWQDEGQSGCTKPLPVESIYGFNSNGYAFFRGGYATDSKYYDAITNYGGITSNSYVGGVLYPAGTITTTGTIGADAYLGGHVDVGHSAGPPASAKITGALTGGVSTSMLVNNAGGLAPGVQITFEDSSPESVTVAGSYTIGSLTVPLTVAPVSNHISGAFVGWCCGNITSTIAYVTNPLSWGEGLVQGMLYWDDSLSCLRVFNGTAWACVVTGGNTPTFTSLTVTPGATSLAALSVSGTLSGTHLQNVGPLDSPTFGPNITLTGSGASEITPVTANTTLGDASHYFNNLYTESANLVGGPLTFGPSGTANLNSAGGATFQSGVTINGSLVAGATNITGATQITGLETVTVNNSTEGINIQQSGSGIALSANAGIAVTLATAGSGFAVVQTGTGNGLSGLSSSTGDAVYGQNTSTGNALHTVGKVQMGSLPTSCSGLPTGSLINNSSVVNICP